MSNPHVTIGGFRASGSASLENVSWAVNSFAREPFYLYKKDETAKKLAVENYTPPFNIARLLADDDGGARAGGGDESAAGQPDFLGTNVWKDTYKNANSCFVTANKSVMPKIISPSVKCISNGFQGISSESLNKLGKTNFKWNKVTNGTDYKDQDIFSISMTDKYSFATVTAANSKDWKGYVVVEVKDSDEHYEGSYAESYGVVEAFSLLLDIRPVNSALAGSDGKGGTSNASFNPVDGEDPAWEFIIEFGDVEAKMSNVSSLNVKIQSGSQHVTNVNLASAKAAASTPQTNAMGTNVIQLTFFKCWNGIVVSTGVQDTKEVVDSASTICLKWRDYSLREYLDANFDREDPGEVLVPQEDHDRNYMVDFGESVKLTAKNCRVGFVYIPAFFARNGFFDNWQMLSADGDAAEYEYDLYPVYAINGSKYNVSYQGPNKSSYKDKNTGHDWQYITYSMTASLFGRKACELFGYYIRSIEKDETALKNSNGEFKFSVSGSGAQGDGGSWKDYITSVHVTSSLDGGNSGSISVDGLGFAGGSPNIKQSIGGISIEASGGRNTTSGTIFKGIAMGIGTNASSGGNELTINLVGVEKKLQDIALINPPFVDGWKLSKACNYLFGYAGVDYTIKGNGSTKLPSSTEISRAIFDWKSGTSVEQALDDIMLNTHHTYAIIDGKAVVYELGDDGVPKQTGPDRKGDHDDTNIVQYDQQPDFQDLRNYIVAMGITLADGGTGTQLENIPFRPTIVLKENDTEPKLPWAHVWAQARPGYSNKTKDNRLSGNNEPQEEDSLQEFADNMAKASKRYLLLGKVTIPGDASIKIFDKWGEYVIYSVSHDIDLQSKTWTTGIELMASGDGGSAGGASGGGG